MSPKPTLSDLATLTGGRIVGDAADLTVDSASIDARSVETGGMFMAVPGTRAHGASYADQSAGSCVLTDEEGLEVLEDATVPVLVVDDARSWLGPVSAEIHGHPSRSMTVIGVTGTSGKTTTSYMIEQSLLVDHSVGLIGTTGTRINGRPVPTSLTTPEAPTLQGLFARMRDEGVTHVVMEVSSHALVLGRVGGVDFDVAAFTNLSQDHLDFHPTMEDYFEAKSLLFTTPQDPGGPLPTAVVNIDDDWGRRLADGLDAPVTVATRDGADAIWQVDEVTVGTDGVQHIVLDRDGTSLDVDVALPGAFNVANATVALACATAAGEDPATVAPRLVDVRVPGRMQPVTLDGTAQDFMALVDYAHKPAAVAAALDTLVRQRDLVGEGGRVAVVLGAGGNRDHEKRPLMGEAAAERADLVIVTDDNPRDEDPATIRGQVLDGTRRGAETRTGRGGPPVEVREIGDRAEAIRAAVSWAGRGDIVIVAGKGHETGQIVGDTVIGFDDVQELTRAIEQRQDAKR
ncbi:MAG TPA: UDP-N-acetylmuramoyl-L-alanyl-D-glutamate--2,6-diaminopimelate ligase [Candidatus Corynebacterium avicola]|uniref:UDP-N-acetylmuramoyl-L-alanyl-D-glutamate--2,6-diaminopimelate ligase n=1 Tax=Candidatus Corynebacterium avicola TaxID=2838527 RepID=A0A9D1UN97_9CORY|nr:UDP-N-acetylmuramoyl-L-alanyl-D-glutamate--2,6-diaminopimelate ligase [Candidatus Corynebacterium avicola]